MEDRLRLRADRPLNQSDHLEAPESIELSQLDLSSTSAHNVYAQSQKEARDPIAENIANQDDDEDDEVPPNGGYGWVCTACVFMINAHTWGVNSAWGIFLAYYLANSTFPHTTSFQYALIGGLSISQALLISPLVTSTTKRIGARVTMVVGAIIISVALLTSSFATQIWHLFLSQGLCFGWGMGFIYIPATSILPGWFSTRRSLAVGLATSGAGLGGLAYNLAAGRAVETLGVEWTYRILAVCSLVVNTISAALLKDRMKRQPDAQHRGLNYRALKRVEIVLVMVWGMATELGYVTLLYSLPHYASSVGLTSSQGSIAGALLNLGLGIGRPVVGYYSDRLGRINTAMSMTFLCGLLCISMWIPAQSYGALLAFAILAGTVCGTFWCTIAPVLAEVVGINNLAPIFGIICFTLVLPTTFGEPIAMELVKATGSSFSQYLVSQVFVALTFLIGAISLWFLRSWKIYDLEMRDQSSSMLGHWLTPKRLFSLRRV